MCSFDRQRFYCIVHNLPVHKHRTARKSRCAEKDLPRCTRPFRSPSLFASRSRSPVTRMPNRRKKRKRSMCIAYPRGTLGIYILMCDWSSQRVKSFSKYCTLNAPIRVRDMRPPSPPTATTMATIIVHACRTHCYSTQTKQHIQVLLNAIIIVLYCK